MSKILNRTGAAGFAADPLLRLARLCFPSLALLGLLLASGPARGDDGDDEYLAIHWKLLQADNLSRDGKTAEAQAKYREVQTALEKFHAAFPRWYGEIVKFRLSYVADKLTPQTKPAAAPAAAPAAEAETPSTPAAASGTAAMQVKLLEPGAEPRRVLRLHPKPGDQQKAELTLKLAIETKLGEMQAPPVKVPPIKLAMGTTVKEVSPEGDISYESVVSDASVADEPGTMPQVAQALKTQLGGVKGMTGTGKLSSRGFNEGLEFKAPAGTDPQVAQAMDQMKESFANLAAPLPEEAIGLGAKWEASQQVKSQGITIDQTTTYELTALEGERLTTKCTLAQHAANQKMQNPAMQGLTLDLTKMTASGSGDKIFDLGQLLPSAATMDLHSVMAMSMGTGAQKQAVNLKMDVNVKVEGK